MGESLASRTRLRSLLLRTHLHHYLLPYHPAPLPELHLLCQASLRRIADQTLGDQTLGNLLMLRERHPRRRLLLRRPPMTTIMIRSTIMRHPQELLPCRINLHLRRAVHQRIHTPRHPHFNQHMNKEVHLRPLAVEHLQPLGARLISALIADQ